jgi:hypothetical protein
LAQAYLRIGDQAKAKAELELHTAIAKQAKQHAESQHNEVQEFVVTLRSGNSTSASHP